MEMLKHTYHTISQSRYENDAPTKALTFNEMNVKSIKKQASTISYKCELNVSYTYLILLKMMVLILLLIFYDDADASKSRCSYWLRRRS